MGKALSPKPIAILMAFVAISMWVRFARYKP